MTTQEGQAIAALVDRFPLRVREWMLAKIEKYANIFLRHGIGALDETGKIVRLDPHRRGYITRHEH